MRKKTKTIVEYRKGIKYRPFTVKTAQIVRYAKEKKEQAQHNAVTSRTKEVSTVSVRMEIEIALSYEEWTVHKHAYDT